jgi:hypothetical protein
MLIDLQSEAKAHRLRLTVTDNENPPLTIDSIKYSAAARQIVIANTGKLQSPLRVYYGNPAASAPQYDFGRNLPERLAEKPMRLTFGERIDNPAFTPPPQAFTERWPWLVYTVLTVVCVALAGIVVSIALKTLPLADPPTEQPTPSGA